MELGSLHFNYTSIYQFSDTNIISEELDMHVCTRVSSNRNYHHKVQHSIIKFQCEVLFMRILKPDDGASGKSKLDVIHHREKECNDQCQLSE